MFKKVISFILLAGMALSVAACNQSGQSEGGNRFTGELERNVTIKIQENNVAVEKGYLDEIIAGFNEKYAEYGIKAVDANMSDQMDLAEDGPYGYGPDVLYGANDKIMPYAQGKHVLPLPVETLECYEKVDENSWNAYAMTYDGEEYTIGVPVNIQEPVMFYRKDLIPENWEEEWDDDKNGVPDMLENMSAMYRFSKWRKESDPTGKNRGLMLGFGGAYNVVGFLYTYGAYTFGNNNTDISDIGHSKGEAVKGANIVRQLASVMDERTLDDSIAGVIYTNFGNGQFFAYSITPDVYANFIEEMVNNGMTEEEAVENLGVADIPMLPAGGDLTDESETEFLPTVMMGGINGYAISSYTKSPNACLAFIDYATSYESIKSRAELLGIVPARNDIADDVGGLSAIVNQNMADGKISIMPSVPQVTQIWTPLNTLFIDLASDAFRTGSQVKYDTTEKIQAALEKADQQIYDSIFTLS